VAQSSYAEGKITSSRRILPRRSFGGVKPPARQISEAETKRRLEVWAMKPPSSHVLSANCSPPPPPRTIANRQ
jgi:hypothetical protein